MGVAHGYVISGFQPDMPLLIDIVKSSGLLLLRRFLVLITSSPVPFSFIWRRGESLDLLSYCILVFSFAMTKLNISKKHGVLF